ncbi:hypothetical protein LINPERHAP2_LOCUS3507 [Linum perenne]
MGKVWRSQYSIFPLIHHPKTGQEQHNKAKK